jgi:glycosyltransferase involved in cell wall biosynthesis
MSFNPADMESVAAFTDTYLPTVNGVTYTVKTWRERWEARGGRMDVVFPGADGHTPEEGEHAVRSLPFPMYDGFRFGVPRVPGAVKDAEVVHAHTPFSLGIGGLRLARRHDRPFVASYHTPTGEYASYLTFTSWAPMEPVYSRLSEGYERWFFSRADAVVVPSEQARTHLVEEVGVGRRGPDTHVEVVSNGVDVERFRPADGESFRERYGLGDGPLVGYTGRHGYEKHLGAVFEAAAGLDGVTVVFGGDGPAREDLERRAAGADVEARFLGFLDREELPAFYSALDVFAFPSPVETQGLVALEATACGTPVVAVDRGALTSTVEEGRNGFHFRHGDAGGFRDAIGRALAERDRLSERCLSMREEISVERAVDDLGAVYDRVG